LRDRFTAMDEGSEKSGRRSELQSAVAIDLEDIRSAIEGALETGAAVTGAELFVATARFTLSAGNSRALRLQGESFAAALVEGDPRLLARIWHEIAFFAQWSRGRLRILTGRSESRSLSLGPPAIRTCSLTPSFCPRRSR
jgi:hypothetical protein